MEYDTLCFSGGGMKGFIYLGILKYLNDIKFININNINNFIGTSIGALLSFLLSIGFSVEEIIYFVLKFNFKLLIPDIDTNNILKENGIDDGENVIKIFKMFLKHKLKCEDLTFKEHYNLCNKKLSVVVTNYTKSCEEVCNYINTPNMSIIIAIRMSISIPFIFTPVLYEGNYYVDGGVTNNFPINHCNLKTTLGFIIVNEFINEMTHLTKYLHSCFSIIINSLSIKYNIDNINIIKIKNIDIKFMSFDLDFDYKLKLINIGFERGHSYIKDLDINICKEILNNLIDLI
jgi:predicted patatin/cPLA2 family phospholipase